MVDAILCDIHMPKVRGGHRVFQTAVSHSSSDRYDGSA
jgi:hypothetical protein